MADCFVFIVSMAVSVIHVICRNLNKLPLLKKYLAVVKLEVHMKLAGIKLRLEDLFWLFYALLLFHTGGTV